MSTNIHIPSLPMMINSTEMQPQHLAWVSIWPSNQVASQPTISRPADLPEASSQLLSPMARRSAVAATPPSNEAEELYRAMLTYQDDQLTAAEPEPNADTQPPVGLSAPSQLVSPETHLPAFVASAEPLLVTDYSWDIEAVLRWLRQLLAHEIFEMARIEAIRGERPDAAPIELEAQALQLESFVNRISTWIFVLFLLISTFVFVLGILLLFYYFYVNLTLK